MSDEVKNNARQGLINEGHLHEILSLLVNEHLSPWLTTEEARQEMIDKTIKHNKKEGYGGNKKGKSTKTSTYIYFLDRHVMLPNITDPLFL